MGDFEFSDVSSEDGDQPEDFLSDDSGSDEEDKASYDT